MGGTLAWRVHHPSARGGDATKSPLRGMMCAYERTIVSAMLDARLLRAAEAYHRPPQQYPSCVDLSLVWNQSDIPQRLGQGQLPSLRAINNILVL